MPRPAVAPLGEQVYADLWPLAAGDEDRGWALLLLIGLLAQPFAEVDELVGDSDDGTGWSIIFDVDRTPGKWLAFPAALIGARPPEGLTDDQRRGYIKDVGGIQRGTPGAIKAAASSRLTGARRVLFVERNDGAWRDTLITYTPETPDPAAVETAVTDPTVKPAGRKLTYRTDPGWDIDQMETAQTDLDALETAYPDLDALETQLPAL